MSLYNSTKWIALSKLIQIVIQVVCLTILTRLLEPKEYGLMAMATVVTNFTLVVRDLGTAAAVIQRRELNQAIKSTVFWINIAMGVIISLAIISMAPFVSEIFNEPEIMTILLLLALSFPVSSLGTTQQALLERELQFKKLAIIEVFSAIAALIVALMMAYNNFGVYSLVGQVLTSCSLSSFLLWHTERWRPSFVFAKSELRQLFRFSGNLTAFNLINYFSRNSDTIIIGHYFSATVLGAYTLAYRLMLFPIQSLTSVIMRSLYPLLSRNQDNPNLIKTTYLKVLTFIASITAPMMAGLVVLREPFVTAVFGGQWALVPAILLWLGPTGFIQSLISTTGSIFMAHGKTKLLMILGAFSAVLQVSAFIIGSKYNVQVIACLYFIANVLNAIPALYYTMKLIRGSYFQLIKRLVPPLLCSVIMIIVLTQMLNYSENFYGGKPQAILIINSLLGIFVYITSYRLFFSTQMADLLPARLNKWFFYRK